MEMTYDGALVMPKNFAVVNEEEMEYVDGGGLRDIVEDVLAGLIVAGICAIGKTVTKAKVLAILKGAGTAAKAIWTAVKAGVAFVWNHPALCICLGVAVGIGVGLVIGYFHWR